MIPLISNQIAKEPTFSKTRGPYPTFDISQVSPEILTQAKNEAKSPNQSKAIFEYLWVGKV